MAKRLPALIKVTLSNFDSSLVNMRVLCFFMFLFVALNSVAQDEITLPENTVYIDVRTWIEYKVDNIQGDVRIHVSDIVAGVTEQYPAKDTPIRLYCARGVRSSRAVNRLKAQGYSDVQNLGGINDARKLRGLTP